MALIEPLNSSLTFPLYKVNANIPFLDFKIDNNVR